SMVLGPQGPGRVERRQAQITDHIRMVGFLLFLFEVPFLKVWHRITGAAAIFLEVILEEMSPLLMCNVLSD
ncbi:hypothetical protein A8990_13582, partial [Paenibacillus taihuensis]